jgi:hypothetical protein
MNACLLLRNYSIIQATLYPIYKEQWSVHPTTNWPACGLNAAKRWVAAALAELAGAAGLTFRDQGE